MTDKDIRIIELFCWLNPDQQDAVADFVQLMAQGVQLENPSDLPTTMTTDS